MPHICMYGHFLFDNMQTSRTLPVLKVYIPTCIGSEYVSVKNGYISRGFVSFLKSDDNYTLAKVGFEDAPMMILPEVFCWDVDKR